ncbi:MAG: PilN domain-containing protein [Phycisphaerae bacterium]|jgi:Tfp pilus assembly protein PilN
MAQIDFVPDDYIQRKESRRANFFYLALLALIVAGITGSFGIIKVRQHAVKNETKAVDARMAIVQQAVKQLEQLQVKKQEMMKTALLTAELIEPVPRSLIVAMLTNFLPDSVSLSKIKIVQKASSNQKLSQYDAAKAAAVQKSPVQDVITELEIEGLAASDIGVADYIANLSKSNMLENVSLVQSKQKDTVGGGSYREFKLTAQIRRSFTAGNDEVEKIRNYQSVKKL